MRGHGTRPCEDSEPHAAHRYRNGVWGCLGNSYTEGEIWMVEWMFARWSESPAVILESLEDSGAPESILSLVRDRIEK